MLLGLDRSVCVHYISLVILFSNLSVISHHTYISVCVCVCVLLADFCIIPSHQKPACFRCASTGATRTTLRACVLCLQGAFVYELVGETTLPAPVMECRGVVPLEGPNHTFDVFFPYSNTQVQLLRAIQSSHRSSFTGFPMCHLCVDWVYTQAAAPPWVAATL